MPSSSAAWVSKRRAALPKRGLRPVPTSVLDTRQPGFIEECRRQSRLVAEADLKDPELLEFLDAAWEDLAAMEP